jgi:hypothetical protein
MKIIVCLIAGVSIGYLLMRLLSQLVGWAPAWPIFALAACALGFASYETERRSGK